ncbi:putative phosphoenolpyruvate synthase [Oppia nitens]|uniref:putative phosphoenolpyruvate synthase n=1 Tax=Oppia nitens TaxID=1686743 RepID=UPI0023D9919D|nr:putative phosphoenolpyruvate synthase [Oppia nitens]
MKNTILSDICKHKSLHKDWINCFDITSDLTNSGILARDQLWQTELPNKEKEEIIVIYGVNSFKSMLNISLKTKPVIDEKNNDYYKCNETGISYNISNKNEYKFPGLLLEVLAPFQRWRVKFNGFLTDKNNQKFFIEMRLFWFSTSEVFDYKSNGDNKYLAKEMNGMGVKLENIFEDRYVVCGQLRATLKIDNEINKELFLWGTRSKAYYKTSDNYFVNNFDKYLFSAYTNKGIALEIIKITPKHNQNKCMYYGWALASHGCIYPIQTFIPQMYLIDNNNQNIFPSNFKLQINGKEMIVNNLIIKDNNIINLTINGHNGLGFILENQDIISEMIAIKTNTHLFHVFKKRQSQDLVLNFEDENAMNEELSGGKGSSLSKLKVLSKLDDNCFIVPNGFIVTTNAYQFLLKENPDLDKAIERLQTISWSEKKENFQEECQNVMNNFLKIEMPLVIKSSIRDSLQKLQTNGNTDDIVVAVRSSACGEDSEDMSAAGQMTTYLGIKGLNEICESVLKCWSSQFNIIAVEYKRGYGQLINSPMAVVVQEMVDCDVAGVMFTCDPVNGTPNKIIINANYGIGESVVSAAVNPDNISLIVDMEFNSYDNQRCIKSINDIIIGAKESVMKIKTDSGAGIEIQTNDSNASKCCLSDDQIKTLGEIGLKLQYYFGCERDIEWGLKDGLYYMFQSRPVTNLNAYNEWELTHEFDTGHLDEAEYNTRANLGEVMPGAISTLHMTAIFPAMWLQLSERYVKPFGMKYNAYRRPLQAVTIQNNAVFFSLKDVGFFQFAPKQYETFLNKALTLAAFGHPVEDEQLREDAFERNGILSLKTKIAIQKSALKSLTSGKKLKKFIQQKQDISFIRDKTYNNSFEMFRVFCDNLNIMAEALDIHLEVSTKSSIHNLMLLSVLSNGNIDVTSNSNLYIDFANVLSMTGNSIVSADVPKAIKQLAKSIKDPKKFKDMTPEEALEWLENNNEETAVLYKHFMKDYGFRGYKEWDVLSKTWSENMTLLVTTIQTMIPFKENSNQEILPTIDEHLSKLKTSLSTKQKWLLKKWIIPYCQSSIAHREESKLIDIKCIDKFRQLLRKMGEMMCYKEGRIPDPELIYFVSLQELKILTETRVPKIVMKAKQRKRIYQKLDQNIYEEMSVGPDIRPRNLIDKNDLLQNLNPKAKIPGTPVCTGSITAKACVAKCFDDAKNIQPGDILVTYCTDIGWSPYLPMISGIITEIGGLVSHGAVIAREYGIPCLVGVKNACYIIPNGHTVLLDADNGHIVLINEY